MRRRTDPSISLPGRYQAAALPEWVDDLSAPTRERVETWNQWWATREAWLEGRHAWIDTNQPDRADYYATTEPDIPDAPFDPDSI